MKKQTKAMLMAVTMAASAMTACVPKATTETTAATEVAGTHAHTHKSEPAAGRRSYHAGRVRCGRERGDRWLLRPAE